MKYKLIVSDIDGVWTDGSFYYSTEGDVLRKFSTRDSYGVSLCQIMDLPILILSTESNNMVLKRMKKLKLDHVELGVRNKLQLINKYCEKFEIGLREVAYIGDDMNDFHLLGKVGLFACPADAYLGIRKKADMTLQKSGGEGVFREFVEYLLKEEGYLEQAYEQYNEKFWKKQG